MGAGIAPNRQPLAPSGRWFAISGQRIVLRRRWFAVSGQRIVLSRRLLAIIGQRIVLRRRLLARIGQRLVLRWRLLARIGQRLVLRWRLLARIVQRLVLRPRWLARIGQRLVLRWRSLARIVQRLVLRWRWFGTSGPRIVLRPRWVATSSQGIVLRWRSLARIGQRIVLSWQRVAMIEVMIRPGGCELVTIGFTTGRTRLALDSPPSFRGSAFHRADATLGRSALTATMFIPKPHARFLENAVPRLAADRRIVGVAAGGLYPTGAMDEFSDLDLLLVVDTQDMPLVLAERMTIAESLGVLLAAFTGEHVGEPRLLICLYDAPLLHVDLKPVTPSDLARRVEDPVVLWERDHRVSEALATSAASYPDPDVQWIEDRFWVWVHYGATKIGRGEIFEALDFLSYLRGKVLGPLGLKRAGARPAGVRKIELAAPQLARALLGTVASHDAGTCLAALEATVELYRELRATAMPAVLRSAAERAATAYLAEVGARLSPGTGR